MINKPPNTLIIGPGALGLGLAALFYKDNPVAMLGRPKNSPIHKFKFLEASNEAQSQRTISEIPLKWIDPQALSKMDFDQIWITTPAYGVKDALISMRDSNISANIIFIASNGLGHFETARETLGIKAPICRALVEVGFKLEDRLTAAPSVFITGKPKVTLAGEANIESIMSEFCISLKAQHWVADVSLNPIEAEWRKVIFNIFVNPICALLGCPNGEVLKSALPVAWAAAQEASAVAKCAGIDVSNLTKESLIHKVSFSRSNICSTLAQLQQKKPTELDYITGKVIAVGKTLGVATPVLETLHLLVKSKEIFAQN